MLDERAHDRDTGATGARAVRVLVLCADIGEGHVTVARRLVDDLDDRDEVEAVGLRTDLQVLGAVFGSFMDHGFHLHLDGTRWTYELAYRVFFERASPRRAAELALAVLGGRGLRRTLSSFGPDVVVTEFPVLSAPLGVMRALGRIRVPVCSSISDPAGLYYWAHPGIDLHLLSWPEAVEEVDQIAGAGRAAVVRPLVDRRFATSPAQPAAREALSLPQSVPVVAVSGGGWGLGDLPGATAVALESTPETIVVSLAGRNELLHDRLAAAFGDHPRVRVLGFSDQMPELLAAADAVIHTTGGTTALEARVVGCPLVNYGRGVAHVRTHAGALARRGLAEWAPDRAALAGALRHALAAGRRAPLEIAGLPDAASLVIELARAGGRSAARRAAAV